MVYLPKVKLEKTNTAHKLAHNVYPCSPTNEVQAQVRKARAKKVATSEGLVKNILPKKLPKAKY